MEKEKRKKDGTRRKDIQEWKKFTTNLIGKETWYRDEKKREMSMMIGKTNKGGREETEENWDNKEKKRREIE